jgi:hypothetical protein
MTLMMLKMGKKYGKRRKRMVKQKIINGLAWGAA